MSSKLPTDAACFGLKGTPELEEPVSWGGDDRAATGQGAEPSVRGSHGPGKPPNAALPDHTIYEEARKPGHVLTLTMFKCRPDAQVALTQPHQRDKRAGSLPVPADRVLGLHPGRHSFANLANLGTPCPENKRHPRKKFCALRDGGPGLAGDQLRMLVRDEAPGEGPFQARGPQDGCKKRGDTSREPSVQRTCPRATDRAQRKLPPSQASAPEVRGPRL